MFVLKHQDDDIKFEFNKGGFVVLNSKLYISIETKSFDEEDFPDSFLFAIDGFCLDGELEDSVISISTNPNDESPNVYVYSSFHANEVVAKVLVKVLSSDEINVELDVISDDVHYYNEKAKPNSFIGSINLERKSLDKLWMPV